MFFQELLRENLGVRHLIDSKFAMLNKRLAEHYGMAGVEGVGVRRVSLPDDSVRGGLMTQASVLKVTANGTTTSPVVRGAWIMERLLGKPPPPPPPSIPAGEPDIRGATTIREQLAKHRSQESCNASVWKPTDSLPRRAPCAVWRWLERAVAAAYLGFLTGARLCPQDQPQRVGPFTCCGWSRPAGGTQPRSNKVYRK